MTIAPKRTYVQVMAASWIVENNKKVALTCSLWAK